MIDSAGIATRLNGVRARIADAVRRARRDPSSVRLVAVSKTFPPEAIRAAADAGQLDFGENKVQEGLTKITAFEGSPLRWHLIGHLQSNKAKKAGAAFDAIHSIDDPTLVPLVAKGARETSRTVDLLVQVDLAGESTKSGLRPEHVRSVFEAGQDEPAVRLVGLMVLPPATPDPEGARPYFAALRRLRDDLVRDGIPPSSLRELSMGMSHDFEVAVEEGATMVRVGSAIFGERARG